MTIAPSLSDIDVAQLERARSRGNTAAGDAIAAALAIDQGDFPRAQDMLLSAINAFASMGGHVCEDTRRDVTAVRGRLAGAGHRYQTGAVRSCLDIVEALAVNPRTQSMGERVGRLQFAVAELRVAQSRLWLAAA